MGVAVAKTFREGQLEGVSPISLSSGEEIRAEASGVDPRDPRISPS